MKTIVTFGQGHTHRVNGKTLDCNCVALIEGIVDLTGGGEDV